MNPEYFSTWLVNSFRVQILAIEFAFCWMLPKKRYFYLKLIILCALFIFFPLHPPKSILDSPIRAAWVPLSYPVLTIISAGIMGLMYRLSGKQMLFYGCLALMMQHLVHCMSRIVRLMTDFFWWQLSEVLFLVIVLLLSWFYLRDRFCDRDTANIKSGWLLGFSAVSIVTTCIVSYFTANLEQETLGYYFYDIGFCVLLLMIILDVFQKSRAEEDHTIMLHLLKQEQEQHDMSRETADIINRKCHDLKHQISALRHMSDADRESNITELERSVMLYENFIQSGNRNVDLILAEKNLMAEGKSIKLMCMVDGEKLNFLKTEDLYSILGNALDNAIESSEKEMDPEKRIIEVHIFQSGIFISIHISNPCAERPDFVDGLPVTTKQDKDYHGFGMRSMRYIVEHYDGALTASWEDGVYILDILFPRK